GGELRIAGGEVGRGVTPLGSGEDASDELLALVLALLRGGEEEIQDVLRPLDVLHGVGTGFVDPAVHLTAALRTGRCEDHSAYEVRALQRYLLGDEAAHGE